ncbi:hypothetical protein BaRGS_00026353, partial [Batillaria attramentaria]
MTWLVSGIHVSLRADLRPTFSRTELCGSARLMPSVTSRPFYVQAHKLESVSASSVVHE